MRTQVALLGVARSGLYYRPVPPSAEEVQIKHRLDELYTQGLCVSEWAGGSARYAPL